MIGIWVEKMPFLWSKNPYAFLESGVLPNGSLSWANFHICIAVFLPFVSFQLIAVENNKRSAFFCLILITMSVLSLMIMNDGG